jgi:hypothetical protein
MFYEYGGRNQWLTWCIPYCSLHILHAWCPTTWCQLIQSRINAKQGKIKRSPRHSAAFNTRIFVCPIICLPSASAWCLCSISVAALFSFATDKFDPACKRLAIWWVQFGVVFSFPFLPPCRKSEAARWPLLVCLFLAPFIRRSLSQSA